MFFAVVCLVRYTPRARDGYIFAYKDMDETVGPCASKCPASILSLLTPTESQWANAWRARCRTVIAARSTDTAKPQLRGGQTIVFDAPTTCTDPHPTDRLPVIPDPAQPSPLALPAPRHNQHNPQ